MARRTQIQDFEKIHEASDLEDLVKDKRVYKRANKKKAKRRNRHYGRTLLKHWQASYDKDSEV